MPSNPFDVVLPEREIAAIADAAVADLAQRLAQRAFRPMGDPQAGPGEVPEHDALAILHALVHLQHAIERQKDRAATTAAREGAGYPQLGAACNMSRQGARRRWPGLVSAGHPEDEGARPRPADGSH
ncbi:hypothetical protein [Streptacidiphilus sp. P02-A3a]|uniref:hypothetical protein n=1 Tax=Streptacidiphilus sp. P02-A3a TaxID=2704468 RepID=UPI0015F8B58E